MYSAGLIHSSWHWHIWPVLLKVGMLADCPLTLDHKGCCPGFVQADRSGKLWWGNFAGKNVFSSLGKRAISTVFAVALCAGGWTSTQSSYTTLAELVMRVACTSSHTPIASHLLVTLDKQLPCIADRCLQNLVLGFSTVLLSPLQAT